MVEITHQGWWIRWSSLDRTDKWLAGTSTAFAVLGSLPIGLRLGHHGYLVGNAAGAGKAVDATGRIALSPNLFLTSLALMVVSAILWWRFSIRQDELFNRIQNWALGMAGGWSTAGLVVWSYLAATGLAAPLPPVVILASILILLSVFWFIAVRRWAS